MNPKSPLLDVLQAARDLQREVSEITKPNILLSSAKLYYETPRAIYDPLHRKYTFTLDPAASHWNALADRYCTEDGFFRKVHSFEREVFPDGYEQLSEEDGLTHSWQGQVVFCNPPYGREIRRWVQKMAEESQGYSLIVALLPARTGTNWWHEWVLPYADVQFLQGRIHFELDGVAVGPATFDSAIVRYR